MLPLFSSHTQTENNNNNKKKEVGDNYDVVQEDKDFHMEPWMGSLLSKSTHELV